MTTEDAQKVPAPLGPVERMVRPPMSDAQLMADLAAVDAEVARRKKAYPFEPYAVWAMNARQAALARFEQRVAA